MKMAEEEKERVARQKEELKKKGYFTLEDGTKTSDPINANLFKTKKKKSKDESRSE